MKDDDAWDMFAAAALTGAISDARAEPMLAAERAAMAADELLKQRADRRIPNPTTPEARPRR